MNLPVYKLVINEDEDETGVDFVALVDKPAIQINWQSFNESKQYFTDEEKRVVSGPLMVADMPIYRRDNSGEYYAVFDAATIEQIILKFSKNKAQNNVNLMHDGDKVVQDVFMFESFIIDRKRGINPPTGFEELTDGSWFGSYKVNNDKVWADVKAGTFQGFSVEGVFAQVKVDDKPQEELEQLIDDILFIVEKMQQVKK
jgi:hypothetical protein